MCTRISLNNTTNLIGPVKLILRRRLLYEKNLKVTPVFLGPKVIKKFYNRNRNAEIMHYDWMLQIT